MGVDPVEAGERDENRPMGSFPKKFSSDRLLSFWAFKLELEEEAEREEETWTPDEEGTAESPRRAGEDAAEAFPFAEEEEEEDPPICFHIATFCRLWAQYECVKVHSLSPVDLFFLKRKNCGRHTSLRLSRAAHISV